MSEKQNKKIDYIKMLAQIPIVDSIDEAPSVETLEGLIGPLVNGIKGAAHYIKMPADMYCKAHKHSTESIIYTANGNWVLYSEGQRHLMKEGSLYFMPPNVETGYEVPFDKPATILIVKFEGPNDIEAFMSRMENMKVRLEERKAQGEPLCLSDLPPEHPARIYAKKLTLAEW
jgi:quercetin dioxygenase-like cupin family protein